MAANTRDGSEQHVEDEAAEALNTSGSVFSNCSIFTVISYWTELSLCTGITATAEHIYQLQSVLRDRKLKSSTSIPNHP